MALQMKLGTGSMLFRNTQVRTAAHRVPVARPQLHVLRATKIAEVDNSIASGEHRYTRSIMHIVHEDTKIVITACCEPHIHRMFSHYPFYLQRIRSLSANTKRKTSSMVTKVFHPNRYAWPGIPAPNY